MHDAVVPSPLTGTLLVQVIRPGLEETMELIPGDPPFTAGGLQETVSALVPETTAMLVGAFGVVAVFTPADATDATELPAALAATTLNV